MTTSASASPLASHVDVARVDLAPLTPRELDAFEKLDLAYRTLCAILYNYAPTSGHPGGSISSGRIVSSLFFGTMDYDALDPDRIDADVLSWAAGHKALGLYAMSALRSEILRISGAPQGGRRELRLEDLLGFRRNPANTNPLFRVLGAKALDGHPTPSTPFVPLATGASGVGMASSLGFALAAADWFGSPAPRVHVLEGEGGLTPGRVAEALAFASTASLGNVIVHVDWNQSSIDSDRVTREGSERGDYVQWDPAALFSLHDWNVYSVDDGTDLQKIASAHRLALLADNDRPTAIIYRTQKGWRYGIEGRASHGAGHALCSRGFFEALSIPSGDIPCCEPNASLCESGRDTVMVERCYWQALTVLRSWLEQQPEMVKTLAERLTSSRERLDAAGRKPRAGAPSVDDVYALASAGRIPPPELSLVPGKQMTLRGQLGKVLGYLNRFSGGSMMVAAADLLGSTSIGEAAKEFDAGFFDCVRNQDSRTLSIGGICEDAMAGVLSGISSFGKHIGVGSSYAAFLAPLAHIAARLHAIGNQARHEVTGEPARPMILVCAHAGLATGEDGPTHADPQPLQLLQENFAPGALVTLTPWETQEIWPLLTTAIAMRPSVIAPFVTRPPQTILDREALGLEPATDAVQGVYRLRRSERCDATIILQESAVTYTFVTETLPLLERVGIDVEAYYIASAELFDALTEEDRDAILPEAKQARAMGITGFTIPTMYRWIRSDLGRAMTMHPFMHGRYTGSGSAQSVIAEAGLDGESQFNRIVEFVRLKNVASIE
jgi:transketolase